MAAGVVGGLFGALAMDVFARAVRIVNDGVEARGAAPGDDREGRGMQPPQALDRAEQDAAVQTGTVVYRTMTGEAPPRCARRWLGTAAHYGFGAASGAMYGLLSGSAPDLRAGYGIGYGTLVWAVADEGAIPALGLSRGPGDLPLGVHAYAIAGHWVYGATLEASLRLLLRE
jgi:uncharacterized membrane protein YagU involved in acid resistance